MTYFDPEDRAESGKATNAFVSPANHTGSQHPCEIINFPINTAQSIDTGFTAGQIPTTVSNQNEPEFQSILFRELPADIQEAIEEWAQHLRTQNWMLRRRAMERFSMCFADNFLAHMPDMDDEEYESLRQVGFTCLLERLDSGAPITDSHQARVFMDSVHDHHQMRARAWLKSSGPRSVSLN